MYKFLKFIFKLSQLWYFKGISKKQLHKLLQNEANIIICNHPSAFMDPIVLASQIQSSVHFIVAEEFMGPKPIKKYLEHNFKMVPIYRGSTRSKEVHKNTDSFQKCYELLNAKKSIAIYPEGVSETQNWLLPLKTGTARIILEALKKYPNLSHINVVPIALKFQNPHQTRTNLEIELGEMIKVTNKNDFNKVSLTNLMHEKLSLAMNSANEQTEDWINNLSKIVKINFHLDFPKILKLKQTANKDYQKLKALVESVDFKKLDVRFIDKPNKSYPFFVHILLMPLLLPFFALFGPPFLLTLILVKVKPHKYSFEGSLKLAFGSLFSFSWITLLTILFSLRFDWKIGLMLAVFGLLSVYLLPVYDYWSFVIRKPKSETQNLIKKIQVQMNVVRDQN